MKLTLGFSPCPNDTFIFDALVNGKIDTGGIGFEVVLEDVQTLNEWAGQGKLDVSKISYGALPLFIDQYVVLNAGGALGKGVGPLLIGSQQSAAQDIPAAVVAIPGKHTTAHLLFSLAYPRVTDKRFMKFNAIEDFVLQGNGNGQPHLGVIIHENRFTYQQKGLVKIKDLGFFWEEETGGPIPLGGIVMKRRYEKDLHRQVNTLIRKSLEYAFAHSEELPDYVKQHSQEMDESVMRQHIDLYVNDYSLDLGDEGKTAVKRFLQVFENINQHTVASPTGDLAPVNSVFPAKIGVAAAGVFVD